LSQGDAGKDESGRLQNLRFHLQPFCAIWTVEGVSADPRTPGIAGGINGKSYGVHGPEGIDKKTVLLTPFLYSK